MSTRRPDDSGELMYVRCAQCGQWMDVKPGAMNKVSHSLCASCLDTALKGLDGEERKSPGGAAPP